MVQLLLSKGANFSAMNKHRSNAIKEAKLNAHAQIYTLIQSFAYKYGFFFMKSIIDFSYDLF